MAETPVSLQTQLARLVAMAADARANGNNALADVFTDAAAKYVIKLADGARTGKHQPVMQ